MIDQCTRQMQLLLSFIYNIIVVCKAVESIFQLTRFIENEKRVQGKVQDLRAIPKWEFQEKMGSWRWPLAVLPLSS